VLFRSSGLKEFKEASKDESKDETKEDNDLDEIK
jgi:hypothetical protein